MCADGYQELATLLRFPDSLRLRRVLEYIMTDTEARLVTLLPGSFEELAGKLKLDVDTVKKMIRDLYEKGVAVPRNFETLEGMRFFPEVIFFHDRTLAKKDWRAKLPRLADLWNDFLETDAFPAHAEQYAKAEQPPYRILPAYKKILNSPELLPEEDVRTILKSARITSVVPCSCRVRTGSCKKTQKDVCLQFDRSAQYGLAVGMDGPGRPLSYEEALAIVDTAEETGLLHLWENNAKMTGPSLCNCCSCCCILGLPYTEYHVPISKRYARSRYEAKVNPALCNGCAGLSVPRCVAIAPDYFRGCIRMRANQGERGKAVVDAEKCFGCGICALKCPTGAISMELVRPPDHIPGLSRPG